MERVFFGKKNHVSYFFYCNKKVTENLLMFMLKICACDISNMLEPFSKINTQKLLEKFLERLKLPLHFARLDGMHIHKGSHISLWFELLTYPI